MKPVTFLSARFFLWASLVLFAGLGTLVFPSLFIFILLAWPILFLILGLDYARLPRENEMAAFVTLGRMIELGKHAEFEIGIVADRAFRPSRVWFLPPPIRCLEFPAEPITLERQSASSEFDYRLGMDLKTLHLGFEKFTHVLILMPSPLGLWRRRYQVEVPHVSFRVTPSLRRIEEQRYQEIRAQSRMLYQGNRRLLRSQAPDQFHSVRRYQFPDPIRHIDPKKTAKFGELMTRTFDSYFDHHVVIGLDVGRAMAGEIGDQPKQDYYLSSILSIAENAVQARDRVSLFSFSQKLHYVIRSSKQISHFYPVFEGLPPFRVREEESNFELLPVGLQLVAPQRAIFVLFTDVSKPSVQEALAQVLPRIAAKHLCFVISVVDESHNLEVNISRLFGKSVTVKQYTDLIYNCWLEEGIRNFRLKASSRGAGVILVPHSYWLSAVHRLYAELRRSSRL